MSEQYTETVVIIRPSFKKITAKEEKTDACRAALFNHFLYWIARKAKGLTEEQIQNGEFSWYATEDQITTDGLGEAWCKKKVSKEIDTLAASGLIGRRHNTANKWDQTRHYYLSEKEGAKIKEHCINAGICLNHLGLPPCVVQLLESLNAIGQYSIWKCQICRMTNGKCTTAIPKVSTKVSTKGVVILSPTLPQPEITPTLSDDVAPDYENGQPSMQLSTQANKVVDKSASSDNHSQQSYSHKPTTSPATHVGVMPVLEVPMPPGVKIPDAPALAPKVVRQQPTPPAPKLLHTEAAIAICAMYENVAGPGGYAKWDWDAMEEMVKVKPTEADITLIYTSLEGKKRNVEQIWLHWSELPTLRKNPARRKGGGPVDSSYHPELDTPEIQAAREAKNQAMIEKQRAMPELRRQRQEALEAKLKIQKQQERERKAANL